MSLPIPLPARIALACLTLLAAALRFYDGGHSLWLDELHTAWASGGDLGQVYPRSVVGNQTPVYFWLLWGWLQLLGESEAVLRLPSLVASVALVPLSYWFVYRWTGAGYAGLLTAALLAIDGRQIFYAQDARPYAVLQWVALLQVMTFLQVLASPSPRWRGGLILCTLAMIYLHLTAILLPLVEGVIYLLLVGISWRRGMPLRYPLKQASLDALLVGLAALPLVPLAREVFARREGWELFIPRPTWLDYVTQPGVLTVGIVLLAMLVSLSLRKRAESALPVTQPLPTWLLLTGLYAGVIALAWGLSAADVARLWNPRYLLVVGPLPAMIAGLFVAQTRGYLLRSLVCSALVVLLLMLPYSPLRTIYPWGNFSGHNVEDWRAAVATVRAWDPTGEVPVFVRAGLIECTAEAISAPVAVADNYCLLPVNNFYDLSDRAGPVLPLAYSEPWLLSPAAQEAVRARGEVILIIRGNDQYGLHCLRQLGEQLRTPGSEIEVPQVQTWPGRPGVCAYLLRIVPSGERF